MAPEMNEDFVGIHLDSGGTWSFIIPGKIERISEYIGRFEEVAHELFAVCEGFICPTEIEYPVRTYSADGPIKSINPRNETADIELLSVERKTVTNENGLTANDIPFESHVHQSECVCFIDEIEPTRTQAHLTLSDYDGWIDRTDYQHVKPARFGEVFDGQANHDPITTRLHHIPPSSQTVDRDMGFVISIRSPTDIWFKETPVGQANRRRLEAFFERLFERFDVVDTEITSRKPNRTLREFLP